MTSGYDRLTDRKAAKRAEKAAKSRDLVRIPSTLKSMLPKGIEVEEIYSGFASVDSSHDFGVAMVEYWIHSMWLRATGCSPEDDPKTITYKLEKAVELYRKDPVFFMVLAYG